MNTEILAFVEANDDSTLRELSQSVSKFAEKQFTSGEHRYSRSDFSAMAELGLTGASISEEFGGSELSPLEIAAITFYLARAQLGPAVYLSVHLMVAKLIQSCANPDQKGEIGAFLRDLASGRRLGAFCLTEANAGSDASALRTRAEKIGGDYVLNGEKIYITSAGNADLYLVFARTGADPKRGISAFIVPSETPGISFGAPEQKMGCEGSPIATVTLESCKIPAPLRLGDEGAGYKIALSGLGGGRVNIAAAACGIAAKATELAGTFALDRHQFGQPISNFQGIQFMIADLVQLTRAAILLTRDAANLLPSSGKSALRPSIAKCFATDAAMKVTTDAVQIFGGAGYLKEYRVEQLMRDAKMLQIVEGTNQIQRDRIAREFLTS